MNAPKNQLDAVRRIVDELELKIHLAGMEARDRWIALQPRLHALENAIATAGKPIGEAIDREVALLSRAFEQLRDDVDESKR